MTTPIYISCSGLRGGVGTTSVTAMLADSLRRLGESVLVVDLNSSDLLRLHFNIPYAADNGWAVGVLNGSGWTQQTYKIDELLWVLPYGRHGVLSQSSSVPTLELGWLEDLKQTLSHNSSAFSWVLFDVPDQTPDNAALIEKSDLHFLIAIPDAAAHILLGQYLLAENTKVLVNGVNATQALSQAVLLDWDRRYTSCLAPVRVPLDTHVHEALAHKMPATTYFPESAAAQAMHSLALWCVTQRRGNL